MLTLVNSRPLIEVFALVLLGPPFVSEPFFYEGIPPIGTVLQTNRFTVVFESLELGGGGSGFLTVSGKHGIVPRFFGGYCAGEHGSTEQRILADGTLGPPMRRSFRLTYDPQLGVSKLEFYGRLLTIESEGRKLRIDGKTFDLPARRATSGHVELSAAPGNVEWDLPAGSVVIVVEGAGPRLGRAADIEALREQAAKNRPRSVRQVNAPR